MARALFNKQLFLSILLSTSLNLVFGHILIGEYLKSKVSRYKSLNAVNNKLWMEYLEKRLEIITMDVSMYQLTLVQFYKKNLLREQFLKMNALCMEKYRKLQMYVFGTMCLSLKHTEDIPPPDRCSHIINDAKYKALCYRLSSGKR